MTDYEISMRYERLYGHYASLHSKVQMEYSAEKKRAKEEHREPDNSYLDRLEEIKNKKRECRRMSDFYFLRHKAKHPMVYDENAMDNIVVAIMQRAALDYGTALSQKDLVAQAELERFAAGYAQELTNFDTSGIFEQLKVGYGRFCALVNKHALEILEDNKNITNRREDGERRFKYRYTCPVCRGLIANSTPGRKPKKTSQAVTFRCNHCDFFTEVMLNG